MDTSIPETLHTVFPVPLFNNVNPSLLSLPFQKSNDQQIHNHTHAQHRIVCSFMRHRMSNSSAKTTGQPFRIHIFIKQSSFTSSATQEYNLVILMIIIRTPSPFSNAEFGNSLNDSVSQKQLRNSVWQEHRAKWCSGEKESMCQMCVHRRSRSRTHGSQGETYTERTQLREKRERERNSSLAGVAGSNSSLPLSLFPFPFICTPFRCTFFCAAASSFSV